MVEEHVNLEVREYSDNGRFTTSMRRRGSLIMLQWTWRLLEGSFDDVDCGLLGSSIFFTAKSLQNCKEDLIKRIRFLSHNMNIESPEMPLREP
jgi:hypothetical protein